MAVEASDKGGDQPEGSQPQNDSVAEALGKMSGVEEETEATGTTEETETTEEAETTETTEETEETTAVEPGKRSEAAEKRIAELTKARKEAEEKAAAAEQKAKALEDEAMRTAGLHPSYLTQDEAKIMQEAAKLEERTAFLIQNWDGIDGTDGGQKAMTAAEVRKEFASIQSRAGQVLGRANEIYSRRLQEQIEDIQEGRRIRQQKAEAAKRFAVPPSKVVRKPIAAPGKGATPKAADEVPAMRGQSYERFKAAGGTRAAAAAELANLAPPM